MKQRGKIFTGVFILLMAMLLAVPVNAEELEESEADINEETADEEITDDLQEEYTDTESPQTEDLEEGIEVEDFEDPEGYEDEDIWDDDDAGIMPFAAVSELAESTGFRQDAVSGDWIYYSDGEAVSGKDIVQGTVNGIDGWWYIVDGKVTYTTTVAQNKYGWWYVDNGKVNFGYTGFAKNSNGWWYIKDGKVIFSTNSVIQDAGKKIDGTSGWWYVIGGKVQTDFTGLGNYCNDYGWWYIKNGKVDFSVNTVALNNYGWWYVTEGKVQFGYTGVADYSNDYGWWYIKNGKVDFSANTVAQNKYGWWYVLGGKVQFGFTGLGNYCNDYGWWYIQKGKVDFSVNTVAQNNYGWWYVADGKVQFGYSGVSNYSNEYGWWYIKNGKVDFSFTGVASNKHGSWYVKNGKVDFSYNGFVTSGSSTYQIKDGKVVSSSSAYQGYSLTQSQLNQVNSNKGLWISDRTFTKDEIFSLVEKFMSSDQYATGYSYKMVSENCIYDLNPGNRWDCSAMTNYFLSRYICYYASKYYEASVANPSASAAKLQQTALDAVPPASTSSFYDEITSDSLRYYLPETGSSTLQGHKGAVAVAATYTLAQMQSWGNPVYTSNTYTQISADNPGNLQPGDILFFGAAPGTNGSTYGTVTHTAIYIGEYYGKGNGYYMLENTTASSRRASDKSGSGTNGGVQISYFETGIGTNSNVMWHAARVINVSN